MESKDWLHWLKFFLTKDGLSGQDNQTRNNYGSKVNGMEFKRMKGNEESFNTFKRKEID